MYIESHNLFVFFWLLGNLSKDPHEVFDFVVKLISQAKRRPGGTSLEGLYHCLNRTILFLLSRATETLTQQMSVLEALHKLTTNRYAFFLMLLATNQTIMVLVQQFV